jgi:(R,R)-butanediol dehydrogenase/meso-butanediol dehydrogenase/diacetyl reductase
MRAGVYHGPRDVRVEEVRGPGAPGPGEVVLEISRVALCGTDAAEYAHGPFMIPLERRHPGSGHRGPMILGHEMVGRITEVGSAVAALEPGMRVVPGAGMWCGECAWCHAGRTNLCARYYTLGLNTDGGLADRAVVPAKMCRAVPAGCTDDAAAMAQPLAVALHALERGRIAAGEAVVLIGVGGIGQFAVAGLARRGARVVALDVEAGSRDSALRLGALAAADPRDPELGERLAAAFGGDPVDVVVEASGVAPSPALAQRLVRRGGRIVLVGMQKRPTQLDLTDLVLREVDLVATVAHVCGHDLPSALELLAAGSLADEVLDRVIGLEAVVEEGLEPLARGRVAGKVVVAVG